MMTFTKFCDKYPHYLFGTYGIRCFFLFNERQFRQFAKDAGLKGRYAEWITTIAGRAIYCETQEGDGPWIVAVILNGDLLKPRGAMAFVSTAVHECCHAFDDVMDHIQERDPGKEIRAYGVDSLVHACLESAPRDMLITWPGTTAAKSRRGKRRRGRRAATGSARSGSRRSAKSSSTKT